MECLQTCLNEVSQMKLFKSKFGQILKLNQEMRKNDSNNMMQKLLLKNANYKLLQSMKGIFSGKTFISKLLKKNNGN